MAEQTLPLIRCYECGQSLETPEIQAVMVNLPLNFEFPHQAPFGSVFSCQDGMAVFYCLACVPAKERVI